MKQGVIIALLLLLAACSTECETVTHAPSPSSVNPKIEECE